MAQLCVMRWWIIKWYWLVLDGIGSVYADTGLYSVVRGQYKLVLLDMRWYRVSSFFLPVYILKKWSFGRVLPIPDWLTIDRQQNIGLLSLSCQLAQLCVTRWWIIKWYWLVLDATGSVNGDAGWYLVALGQYKLVLLGTRKYSVSTGLLCLYKLQGNKVELWSDVANAWHTS